MVFGDVVVYYVVDFVVCVVDFDVVVKYCEVVGGR